MKSARVILTVAAGVGLAARTTQGSDPCESGTFNAQVCQVAIKHNGYCSGGAWTMMKYSRAYPDYYDSYSAYLSGGGIATPGPVENCRQPGHVLGAHGGFGHTGAAHRAGS